MTDTADQIRTKRLAYSRKVHAGEITWDEVPVQFVPEIFKMKRLVHEPMSLTQDEFCRMKDCREEGFSMDDAAFELRKEIKCVQVAWDYDTYSQYKSRANNTPWPNPMDL